MQGRLISLSKRIRNVSQYSARIAPVPVFVFFRMLTRPDPIWLHA